MGLFVLSLVVLLVLGVVLTLAGRAACALCGADWLRRPTLENLAAAAFLGTAVWLLAFGLMSHLGLPGRVAGRTLLAAVALLLAAAWWRRPAWIGAPAPAGRGRGLWWPVLLACLVVAVLAFLPLLPAYVGNCCNPFGDQYTYLTISEWLQEHPFSEPGALDPHQPGMLQVLNYQIYGYRMGAIFFLASLESLAPARYNALDLFLAAVTWGALLHAAGIYLLCRWCLRLRRCPSAAAVLLSVLTFNSLYFSIYAGLLPQLYGISTLAGTLALLSRLTTRARWNLGHALLLGLMGSGVVSVYNEFAPVLGLVGLVFLARHLRRASYDGRRTQARSASDGARRPRAGAWGLWGRRRQFLRFAGLTLLALAVTGNVEHVRALRAVSKLVHVVCGYHLAWSAGEFWSFAVGMKPYWTAGGPFLVGTALATAFLLLGLVCALRARAGTPFRAALGVLVVLTVYYALVARDPWTRDRGHTWSLFKLCQWGFPFLVAAQGAGLWQAFRRRPLLLATSSALACAGAAFLSVPVHFDLARQQTNHIRLIAGSQKPFQTWKQTGPRLDELGLRSLYLVFDAADTNWFPRWFVTYLVAPRPILNGGLISSVLWPSFHGSMDRTTDDVPPDTAYVAWGKLPFAGAREDLPGGLSLLHNDTPVVFKADNPNGVEGVPGASLLWLGREPVRLLIWSPREEQAILSFRATAGPSKPETPYRSLVLTGPDGRTETRTFRDSTTLLLSIHLPRGMSEIRLRCPDEPTVAGHPNGDTRTLLVQLSEVRLAWKRSTAIAGSR